VIGYSLLFNARKASWGMDDDEQNLKPAFVILGNNNPSSAETPGSLRGSYL